MFDETFKRDYKGLYNLSWMQRRNTDKIFSRIQNNKKVYWENRKIREV